VSVLVVDDQESFRDAVAAMIDVTPGFRLASAVASGEEAIERQRRAPVDLVLLDVNLGGLSGIETGRRICAQADPPAVVLMSAYRSAELPAELETLAVPFVPKDQLTPATLHELWAQHAGGAAAHRGPDG
jgi:DNA-binding NarL/FixJ family response regulator